jgi:hypothetical protein
MMTRKKALSRILAAASASLAAILMMTGPADVAHAQGKGKGGGKQGAPPSSTAAPADPALANAEVHTLKVQGNVYMIVGPGGNTAVQIGDSGAQVVDTQYA